MYVKIAMIHMIGMKKIMIDLEQWQEELTSEEIKIYLLTLLNEAELICLKKLQEIINNKKEKIEKIKNVLESI